MGSIHLFDPIAYGIAPPFGERAWISIPSILVGATLLCPFQLIGNKRIQSAIAIILIIGILFVIGKAWGDYSKTFQGAPVPVAGHVVATIVLALNLSVGFFVWKAKGTSLKTF